MASPALRASDADRERAARTLQDAAATGRLSPDELAERLDAAYSARTLGELDALTHDLPPAPPPPPPSARAHARRMLLHEVGFWVLAVVVSTAIWLATGTDGDFWPRWVVLVGAIRLALRSYRLLGPGADTASALEQERERDRRRLGRTGPPR